MSMESILNNFGEMDSSNTIPRYYHNEETHQNNSDLWYPDQGVIASLSDFDSNEEMFYDTRNDEVLSESMYLSEGPISREESGNSNEVDMSDIDMNNLPSNIDVATPNEQCYGMVYHVDVRLTGDMVALKQRFDSAANNTPFILEFGSTKHCQVTFPDGKTIVGDMRTNITDGMRAVREVGDVNFEVMLDFHDVLQRIGKASKVSDALIKADINIYGPANKAQKVGKLLSSKRIWLQKPIRIRESTVYKNPHYIEFLGLKKRKPRQKLQQAQLKKAERQLNALERVVSEVHNSLHRADNLARVAGSSELKTQLLEHQEKALNFLLQRESGEIDEDYRLWQHEPSRNSNMFIHRITKTRSPTRPSEKGGGILADEMGMGKSLSILALILETARQGQDWAEEKKAEIHSSSKAEHYSRGTLVIVPSALLVNNWIEEINTHIGDIIKVIKYHGAGREQDLGRLCDADVVLTTYSTLTTEYLARKRVLHQIHWYRLVLDEAHIIRRPSTTFYRHCFELAANSRWCLTGTPIQNRLDDLGALLAFLRADPFTNLGQFKHYISRPLEEETDLVTERLVMIYESWCLRQTKDILNLPGYEDRIHPVQLTAEEKIQYDNTDKILERSVHQQVVEHKKSQKFGLFQAQLQLRLLCNHGTYQQLFSWKQRKMHEDSEYEARLMDKGFHTVCAGCRQPVVYISGNLYIDFQDCGHIFCAECVGNSRKMGDDIAKGCLLCTLKKGSAEEQHADRVDGSDTLMEDADESNMPKHAREYFKSSGTSSKMDALVEDIKVNLDETKSIVFSCWTRSLDLVEMYLKRHGIDFLRIDGMSSPPTRQKTLDSFTHDSSARVLLMTTGTGAFGLNLTIANRVFVLEPQWNPSVENQAIARALRLRQTEKVLVTRYVVQNTVEESITSQQKKKRWAASLGIARSSDTESSPPSSSPS